MLLFKTGDLIAKSLPGIDKPLQIGIVTSENMETFSVQWTSYNKDFYMEKEHDIFIELNNSYLLGAEIISRGCRNSIFSLLNSSYLDGGYQ